MATNDKLVTSIDYTSRDFYSLRRDLIARVQSQLAENGKAWFGTDPADFGVAMVDAFAHMGDVTSYYIDRAANEAYLSTATQRQSVLNLAKLYGYKVAGWRAAEITAKFTNNSLTVLTIPAGTVVSVDTTVVTSTSSAVVTEFFTLTEDVEVDGEGNVAEGAITHGRNVSSLAENAANSEDTTDIAGELLGFSNGFGNQSFLLKYNQVVDDTVKVFVKNGNRFVEWVEVDSLINYGPSEPVFTLLTDSNNYVTVNFGDGVSGAVPVNGDEIKVTYVVGGGAAGNLDGGKTFTFVSVPVGTVTDKATFASNVTVTSDEPGIGGEDPEAIELIRRGAPAAFRSSGRAVSLTDFKDFSRTVSGVGKSTAYAANSSLVNVYVSPVSADTSSDYFPGFNSDNTAVTTSQTSLMSNVAVALAGSAMVGTAVSVLPPVYVPVTVSIEYVKNEGYTDTEVETAIRQAIVSGYGYNYVNFDQTIRPEKIEQSLSALESIDSVKVLTLFRTGVGSGRTTLVPAEGELFVFKDSTTLVYSTPSLSDMVVTIGNGTLTPAFSAGVTSYAIATTSTSMTVTPTAANVLSGGATVVTVNGTVVASGSASGSISLSSGANTVSVLATSHDATLTKLYTITVTRT